MSFFKVREHKMCFKSAMDCWIIRAPILVFSTIVAATVPVCGYLGAVLFGPINCETSKYVEISPTVTQVEIVKIPFDVFSQSIIYTVGAAISVFILYCSFLLMKALWDEIRDLKSTYNECKCKKP